MLKSILIAALVCYGGLLALLYLTQRAMQYFPERFRTAPAEARPAGGAGNRAGDA